MIRLIVFDTYPVYCIGIQEIFKSSGQIQVVEITSDPATLFPLLSNTSAEVILLGVNLMDNLLCLDVAQRIRRDYPLMKILAYTNEDIEQNVMLLLEAIIHGCIGKRADCDELEKAILKVAAGDE